ncbi:hypothetical protein CIPAW_13G136200 [Carya illinoinensis]|uniref:Uncharacterized protein n=1 Tax=Carya illinoinensis TaxID=32201 RepID=A0A8T1NT83_CARIL|nr:hypothetical protein CIPAW_13G136200 [Carya illinoinensis]
MLSFQDFDYEVPLNLADQLICLSVGYFFCLGIGPTFCYY